MSPSNDNLTRGQAPAFPCAVELSSVVLTISHEGIQQEVLSFAVDIIDNRGGRIGLASADDYEAAMRLAEATRVDFHIDEPVRDNVAGSH